MIRKIKTIKTERIRFRVEPEYKLAHTVFCKEIGVSHGQRMRLLVLDDLKKNCVPGFEKIMVGHKLKLKNTKPRTIWDEESYWYKFFKKLRENK